MHPLVAALRSYRLDHDLSFPALTRAILAAQPRGRGLALGTVHQLCTSPCPTATERTLRKLQVFLDKERVRARRHPTRSAATR